MNRNQKAEEDRFPKGNESDLSSVSPGELSPSSIEKSSSLAKSQKKLLASRQEASPKMQVSSSEDSEEEEYKAKQIQLINNKMSRRASQFGVPMNDYYNSIDPRSSKPIRQLSRHVAKLSNKITEEDEEMEPPDEKIFNDEVNPNKLKNPIFRLPGMLSDCNPTQASTASQERKNTGPLLGPGGSQQGQSNRSEDIENYEEYNFITLESKKSENPEEFSQPSQMMILQNKSSRYNAFRDKIEFSNLTPEEAKIISTSFVNFIEQGREKTHISLVWSDGTSYQGELKSNHLHGFGVLKHSQGYQIEGQFREGKVEGPAKYTNGPLSYEGSWVSSSPHGQGREKLYDVYEYEGTFDKGRKNGKGVLKIKGKGEYEGSFKDNLFHGDGKFVWLDGKRYEGQFVSNKMHGKGKMIWPDGRKYFGKYSANKKEGFGRFVWADGREYIGYWKNGKQHGKGWYIDLNGIKTDTEWENGEKKEY